MHPLSKSKLIAYRQCPKRLWLEVHRHDLREDSAATQARFQTGYQVNDVARRVYDPEEKGALINVETEGYEGAFARTAKLLADSRQPVFEAGFKAEGALAFADMMLPESDKGQPAWRMVEVKSSASVKDYHHDDLAVQTFVAQAAGVPLKSVALAHIDTSWVYPGDEDYRGLLTEKDLTAETFARTEEVRGWIAACLSGCVTNQDITEHDPPWDGAAKHGLVNKPDKHGLPMPSGLWPSPTNPP